MRPLYASALCLTILLVPRFAGANSKGEIPCSRVDADVIHIDGLLEDWDDVQPLIVASGRGAPDFALSVKCNYDDQYLYLVADVEDDHLFRLGGGKAKAAKANGKAKSRTRVARAPRRAKGGKGGLSFPPEDGVEFVLEDGRRLIRLIVLPADPDHDIPRHVYWDPARAIPYEEMDSLQKAGWAVELRLPLQSLPGWYAGTPSLHLAIAAHDRDPKKPPRMVATSPLAYGQIGSIPLGESSQLLEGFLRDRQLSPKEIRFDVVGHGTGHVVLAGKTLAFVSQDWVYTDLPVVSPSDILDIHLVDLAGDGRDAALVRYREVIGTVTREVLAAYRVNGDGLSRIFGVELGRTQGTKRLSSKLSYVKRGAATDILVEALPAAGWNAVSYQEATAEDVVPILLPWSSDKRARFVFKGEEYSRSE